MRNCSSPATKVLHGYNRHFCLHCRVESNRWRQKEEDIRRGSKTVWPDLAKFRHFGTPLKIFGHFERLQVFGKILRWFGQILYAIGQIFIKVNGQRLSKYSSYLVTMVRSDASSVTRLAEISPLWQKIKSLWQIFESLYLIWQNVEPTLANLLHYWANFHCCSWPNIEKQSNLLVTLDASATSRLSSFVRISFNFKTRLC